LCDVHADFLTFSPGGSQHQTKFRAAAHSKGDVLLETFFFSLFGNVLLCRYLDFNVSCPQELSASVALHTANEEDILLRALSVINEKSRRLRRVKEQLADVQKDFKQFKDRTAASAAALAGSPHKKRPKNSDSTAGGGCSSQKNDSQIDKDALASIRCQSSNSMVVEGTATVANIVRSGSSLVEQDALAPATLTTQSSQTSVSTHELTKNFPWNKLGF
jgi:hypothetical protein